MMCRRARGDEIVVLACKDVEEDEGAGRQATKRRQREFPKKENYGFSGETRMSHRDCERRSKFTRISVNARQTLFLGFLGLIKRVVNRAPVHSQFTALSGRSFTTLSASSQKSWGPALGTPIFGAGSRLSSQKSGGSSRVRSHLLAGRA